MKDRIKRQWAMVKYRANYYHKYYIERVNISKETPHFVCVMGAHNFYKEAKKTHSYEYFDSLDKAKNFLTKRIERRIILLRDQIADLEKSLSEIREMEDEA